MNNISVIEDILNFQCEEKIEITSYFQYRRENITLLNTVQICFCLLSWMWEKDIKEARSCIIQAENYP